MPLLMEPLTLRGLELPNRVVLSPMCQYSSRDGYANDWHMVHLGSRAVGGAGLVMTEATAVLPEGRISPQDLGLWQDGQVEALRRITRFVLSLGCHPGIQLAHAGRKGSTWAPGEGHGAITPAQGGWEVAAPSEEAFAENYPHPHALDAEGIRGVIAAFAAAARRALQAGFEVVEIHAAHGYLLHEFLSPLSNRRTDEWGGSFENRIRLLLETVGAVRTVWPETLPLLVRISATDWASGGWDIEQSIELARRLPNLGVDLVDCSSGGLVPVAQLPAGHGYQTAFAARIRQEAGIATGAVGMITSPEQAEHILQTGQADLVVLARELLRDPYWPLHAARRLDAAISWPRQYLRAAPPGSKARENLTFDPRE